MTVSRVAVERPPGRRAASCQFQEPVDGRAPGALDSGASPAEPDRTCEGACRGSGPGFLGARSPTQGGPPAFFAAPIRGREAPSERAGAPCPGGGGEAWRRGSWETPGPNPHTRLPTLLAGPGAGEAPFGARPAQPSPTQPSPAWPGARFARGRDRGGAASRLGARRSPPPESAARSQAPGRMATRPAEARGLRSPLICFLALLLRGLPRARADGLVDVLQAFGVREGQNGVSIAAGICTQRNGSEESDLAFRLENRTHFSVPTRQLFPDGPFPVDFSVLATLRALRGSQSFLFSVYDVRGVQQLGVEIGRSPAFLYEDQHGHPLPEDYPHFHRVNLADGKWHRIALSVGGANVSLSVDCGDPMTLPLQRDAHPVVSVEGIALLGARRADEDVFEGDLQQLLIVPDPAAAAQYCQHYMPDCNRPLTYALHAHYAEEYEAPTQAVPTKPAANFWEESPDPGLEGLPPTTVTVSFNLTDNYEVGRLWDVEALAWPGQLCQEECFEHGG
ncbi:collagen alpha-1(V) chain-like [Paroedura picta]|uniref:collagen alpha-1(V) chain-like n=1 Tax=Paroedura picta TaxID=143630 RepID=UPI004057315F